MNNWFEKGTVVQIKDISYTHYYMEYPLLPEHANRFAVIIQTDMYIYTKDDAVVDKDISKEEFENTKTLYPDVDMIVLVYHVQLLGGERVEVYEEDFNIIDVPWQLLRDVWLEEGFGE